MLSFGVSNLRRLKHVPPIVLKPITILVGRNSSGKSSFLRTFPLLRQSLMTRTSSPILWYGDLVDFGSFDISVSDDAGNEPISFDFRIDELLMEESIRYWRLWNPDSHFRRPDSVVYRGVDFTSSIVSAREKTRISEIHIRIESVNLDYQILVGENLQVISIKLNGQEAYELLRPLKLQISHGTVFPELSPVSDESTKEPPPHFIYRESLYQPIKNILEPYLGKIEEQWILGMIEQLNNIGLGEKDEVRSRLSNDGPKQLRSLVQDIYGQDKRGLYTKLRSTLALTMLPSILSQIRDYLAAVITSTLYIGPARARSERYYRYQDLAVSEIDPDGKNFPMFLNSLASYQINGFSRWIEELFGYGLRVSRQEGGGHMSINLISKGMISNIVDTGYGVSQILPVLGQIWWARNRPMRNYRQAPVALLAIEQPELHLHPAHQALLADALAGEITGNSAAARSQDRIHFLVETHSETLVNRLGELVAKGKILHNDIQIVLFEPLEEDARQTAVTTSSFSEYGELINWPYGFFQPTAG